MRKLRLFSAAIIVCALIPNLSYGLIIPFGQDEIAKAGVGCVGGHASNHGSGAYFRGDTAMLNARLAVLASENPGPGSIKVVLHAGAYTIDDLEEALLGIPEFAPKQIAVDWLVRQTCPFDKISSGTCRCDKRNTVVEIWVANKIKLADLKVPANFTVESAAEIEKFVKHHSSKRQ
ncbi:MAG: hypothetical protein V4719_14985 [Planctomycetota bacterium]